MHIFIIIFITMKGSIKLGRNKFHNISYEMHNGYIKFPQLFGETYHILPGHIVKITKSNIIFAMKAKITVRLASVSCFLYYFFFKKRMYALHIKKMINPFSLEENHFPQKRSS